MSTEVVIYVLDHLLFFAASLQYQNPHGEAFEMEQTTERARFVERRTLRDAHVKSLRDFFPDQPFLVAIFKKIIAAKIE